MCLLEERGPPSWRCLGEPALHLSYQGLGSCPPLQALSRVILRSPTNKVLVVPQRTDSIPQMPVNQKVKSRYSQRVFRILAQSAPFLLVSGDDSYPKQLVLTK